MPSFVGTLAFWLYLHYGIFLIIPFKTGLQKTASSTRLILSDNTHTILSESTRATSLQLFLLVGTSKHYSNFDGNDVKQH